MKTCPTCTSLLEDDINFCTNCGTNVNSQQPLPNQTVVSNSVSASNQAFSYSPITSGSMSPPVGISLIVLYEILFGGVLGLFGLVTLSLFGNNTPSLAGNSQSSYIINGLILGGWGLLAIIGGVLFLRGKIIGFGLSILFLLSTGIILYIFYIPTVIMIISGIYFVFDKKVRKFLKVSGKTRSNKQLLL